MLNKVAFENSQNYGIGVLEIVEWPQGKTSKDQNVEPKLIFALLKKTELSGDITGPMASLRLTQTYRFSKEQCDKVLEARYRFPIPGDAAVTGVKVKFGDTEMQTELKDRNTAKEEYKEAKREGKQAVMVTRESPDVFTICIAGVKPDEDIQVETTYVQVANADGIGWSIRIPLTTSPRYVRKDEFSSRHAQGQPLAILRDPGHRFSMSLRLFGAGTVTSPSHKLDVNFENSHMNIKLQGGEVIPNQDCVLVWKPQQEQLRPKFSVLLQKDEAHNAGYFLAMIAPPASKDAQKVPGEYVILVDHSGSMEGPKWAAADWAVQKFLLGLDQDDTFTLGLFHSTTKWLSRNLLKASENNVKEAVDFLDHNKDSGGTELGVALEQALSVRKSTGNVSRHVLIITDAEVSDEGRILRLADEEYKRKDHRRISILCIDAAPNSFLAIQLAEHGGGIAKFLTSNPEQGDISTALDAIMEDWQQPVYTGMLLGVAHPHVKVPGKESRNDRKQSYIDLGDLTAGRTAWICGKLSGEPFDLREISLSATGIDAEPVKITPIEGTYLKSLYGARTLLGLEFLIHSRYSGNDLLTQMERLGYDPEAVLHKKSLFNLYPENNKVNEMESLRNLIVEESINYGIASSETAFIAVYNKAGKPVKATVLVPNALPDGWSDQFETQISCCKSAPAPSMGMPAGGIAASPLSRSKLVSKKLGTGSKIVQSNSIRHETAAEPVNEPEGTMIFTGMPTIVNGEAVIYDSESSAFTGKSDVATFINRLKVMYPDGAPSSMDKGLKLLIFVNDMLVPRASVSLADLVRMGGVRPLNINVDAGMRVKIVLVDPNGMWAPKAPKIEVAISLN